MRATTMPVYATLYSRNMCYVLASPLLWNEKESDKNGRLPQVLPRHYTLPALCRRASIALNPETGGAQATKCIYLECNEHLSLCLIITCDITPAYSTIFLPADKFLRR